MDQIEKSRITARLKQIITPLAPDLRVTDVRIGLGIRKVNIRPPITSQS